MFLIKDGKYKCIKSIRPVQWLCGLKKNKYYQISYKGICAGILFYEVKGEKPDTRYHNQSWTEDTLKEFFNLTS